MIQNLNTHDINQRYANSYVKEASLGVVSFKGATDTHIVAKSSQGVKNIPLENFKIVKEFPDMGLVNLYGVVHILERIPERQWCRGFAYQLIKDTCRLEKEPNFGRVLTLEMAKSAFDRVWIPKEEGLALLRSHELYSFALNNKYWYSGSRQHIYLWRNKVCIGELLGNKIFFFKESSLLQEEITTDFGELNEN